MKQLSEFVLEKIGRDFEWRSIHGGFNQGHVDLMMKDYTLSEDYLKDILDEWEKEFGGMVEWEIKGKKIKFKSPDSSREWIHDGKKWKEL